MRGSGMGLVHSLAGTAAVLAGMFGMVMVPGPAYADGSPLAQLTATVNPPPQPNGLISLCITSHSLDPSGTCINLPPGSGGLVVPDQTYGTATAQSSGRFVFPSVQFQFQGQIAIGGQTFVGSASGVGQHSSVGSGSVSFGIDPF